MESPHRLETKIPSRDVAVVVSSHQKTPGIEDCLQGFRQMVKKSRDLIFVNNGSGNELGNQVRRKFPGITLINLPKNKLFCGGYNAGIRQALERGYEFILISNADTQVVNHRFLEELLEAAGRWPRSAFVGPLVYWRGAGTVQKTCLRFPRFYENVAIWLPWRIARGWFEQQPAREREVEFLNGVCVLCRAEALKQIGLMDENMGGYVEDADWAWRAKKKGWSSVFIPIPSIVHHENSNGYEPYSLKTFLLKRNTVYWYLKIGRRASALSYARASQLIAMVRFYLANNGEEKNMHRYFLEKLATCFSGLLSNQALGEWFGPPLGPWREEEAS
jgi:GT2 family glycosyltransferase